MLKHLTLVMLLAITSTYANAAEVTLGRTDKDNVFVWKDREAYKEAVNLISDTPERASGAVRFLSCIVPRHTKAMITDKGRYSSTVLITSGTKVGCRGLVVVEDIN